jgi:hypothetical protein
MSLNLIHKTNFFTQGLQTYGHNYCMAGTDVFFEYVGKAAYFSAHINTWKVTIHEFVKKAVILPVSEACWISKHPTLQELELWNLLCVFPSTLFESNISFLVLIKLVKHDSAFKSFTSVELIGIFTTFRQRIMWYISVCYWKTSTGIQP